MTVQITIIGLGQIGASIGLALSDHRRRVKRIGNDIDPAVASKAKKIGAVDKIVYSLPDAVSDADLIVLALPLDEIRETLSFIADHVKEGAVVLDTAPAKKTVGEWAAEILPRDRHYVGLTPVLSFPFLTEPEAGIEAADADLFLGGLIAITSPRGTFSGALKLATDLAVMLRAKPLFADLAEIDSLMAATHLLPQYVAAALAEATIDRPGWLEGRKLAGRPFAQATGPILEADTAGALTTAAVMNHENVVRLLDNVIAALQGIRQEAAEQDGESLKERLEKAQLARAKWWSVRRTAEWQTEGIPQPEFASAGDRMSRIMTGSLLKFDRKEGDKED